MTILPNNGSENKCARRKMEPDFQRVLSVQASEDPEGSSLRQWPIPQRMNNKKGKKIFAFEFLATFMIVSQSLMNERMNELDEGGNS